MYENLNPSKHLGRVENVNPVLAGKKNNGVSSTFDDIRIMIILDVGFNFYFKMF